MFDNINTMVKQLGCWSVSIDPQADGKWVASVGCSEYDPHQAEILLHVYDSHETLPLPTIDDAMMMLDAMCAETLRCWRTGTLPAPGYIKETRDRLAKDIGHGNSG